MSRIPFHRPTRALPPALPDQRVVLPAPPESPQNSGASATTWLTLLLPLMSSISMAAFMVMYRKPLLIALGVVFVLVSVGATIAVRYQMNNVTRQNKTRQRERYLRYLTGVRQTARQVADGQRLAAGWLHPSPERLWALADRRRRVWERRATDEDFLRIRLGQGRAALSTPIQLGSREDPMADYDEKTHAAAQRVIELAAMVGRQPAVVDLSKAGVVSLLGPVDRTRALARSLLCQLAVLHAPDDVTVSVCTGGSPDWEWAKWLPHVHEAGAAGPAGAVPLVAEDFGSLSDALETALLRAQTDRAARRGPMRVGQNSAPVHRLVVLLDSYDPAADWARGTVATALLEAAGPDLGITVICLVAAERDEPTRTEVRARVGEDGSLVLEGRRGELYSAVQNGVADAPDPVLCELTARALAPLSLSEEAEQLLARTITLPEMLGTPDVASFDPSAGWIPAGDERLLRLPIGVSGDGDPIVLDLKESGQGGMGPHGLVVGATGSGKSELLRTMVTGLAMTHSPELLSLVLIDFKGGATFAGVTGLPHVSGLITNLANDLSLVDRVRAALQGEQQRRQRLLRDAGNVDSLREYQLRQAAGESDVHGKPLEPLPYLLIMVDEFGELLSQRADFLDLFVQIGRVGRSLGMHLLLATQRLEEGRLRGLESHLSYRICLRTFSAAESRAVIGTPDAYSLPSIPGSAYLKVDESIYQRFRVAHISGPYVAPGEGQGPGKAPPVVPFELRTPPQEEPAEPVVPQRPVLLAGPTEMQVAVEHVCRFGQSVHQVWLPPLPPAIPLDSLLGPLSDVPGRGRQAGLWSGSGRLAFPVGVIDLPLQQQQLPLQFDFDRTHGNLALVGAPQTGKSTMLRTMLISAMLTHTPEEAQFYCLDFGGGSLHPLESAPHVGAVAGRRDVQRARRVLAETGRLMAAREQLFGELGVDSVAGFRAMRKAGKLPAGTRAADVFLLLDNWGAIKTELEDAEASVVEIASRGLGVGVHVILTANRWADVRMNLRDSIGGRLELRLNDPTESEVSRPVSRQIPHGVPGRGTVPPGVLYQAVLPRLDGQESTEGLAEAQEEAVAKITASWSGPVAPPVRILPERVLLSTIDRQALADDEVAVGLGELDLEPVGIAMGAADPHFLVLGDAASGKSSFLRTWMRGTAARRTAWEARFMVIDYRRSLQDAVPEDYVGAYAGDAHAAEAYTQQLMAKLDERMPPQGISAAQLRARDWWEGPELYVVVDDYDLVASGRQSPVAGLADYVTQAREIGLHVILARRVAGVGRPLMADPLLSRIKELGSGGLILSGDSREGLLLGDQRAAQRPPGRGVLVRRSSPVSLLQVALSDEDV